MLANPSRPQLSASPVRSRLLECARFNHVREQRDIVAFDRSAHSGLCPSICLVADPRSDVIGVHIAETAV
jgi:hypothetical protein